MTRKMLSLAVLSYGWIGIPAQDSANHIREDIRTTTSTEPLTESPSGVNTPRHKTRLGESVNFSADSPARVRARSDREAYVRKVESQMKRYDERVRQLRAQRAGSSRGSAHYQETENQITQMQEKMGQVRANLREIQNSDDWASKKTETEAALSELEQMNTTLAE